MDLAPLAEAETYPGRIDRDAYHLYLASDKLDGFHTNPSAASRAVLA